MKLLRAYIRNLLVEQDEEEQSPEDKLKQLFMHNTTQALHIAEQVDVDPKMVAAMKEVVESVHEIMESFRGAVNAKTQDEAMKVPPVRGLYEQFEQAMIKIYGADLMDSSVELHDIDKSIYDLYNSAFVAREYFGERHTDYIRQQATNLKAYKDAVGWAGQPS